MSDRTGSLLEKVDIKATGEFNKVTGKLVMKKPLPLPEEEYGVVKIEIISVDD